MASSKSIKAGEAYVEILSRDGRLVKGLRSAQKRLSNFAKSVGAIGLKTAGFGASLLGPLALAVKAGSELEETMNKFNVVFGDQAATVKAWGDDFANEVGRSKGEVAAFMASSQDLFVPLGFEPGAATEMSKQITALGVDLASFNNLQDADVINDLQSALTGSGEVMKKYGVLVNEAAVGQQLLAMGMDPKTASDQAKVQARLNIIMAGTTAAQGDAVRSSGSFANQMKALKARIADTAAEVGSVLLPIVTPLITKLAKAAAMAGEFIKKNAGLVIAVAAVAAGITVAGIALLGLSVVAGGLSTVLGAVVAVLPIIGGALAFLVSPVGLILAGLVGGGAAWLTFSESGRNAMAAVSEILDTFKQTLGGVMDALSAGELALAAKIGMVGLRIAMLQGVELIATTVGGAFGDFIASIGSKLFGGDFAGAFKDAIVGIAMLWDKWLGGMLGNFTEILGKITDKWQKTVTGLANFILEQSAKGGTTGKLFSKILGVDMNAEQSRAELMHQRDIEQKTKQLAEARADLESAQAAGGSIERDGQTYTTAELERFIGDVESQLANLRTPDVLAEAQAVAAGQLAASAESLRDTWQDIDAEMKNREQNPTAGFDGLTDTLAGARGELEALLAEAERAAANKAKEQAKEHESAVGGVMDQATKTSVTGTFNGRLAAEMFGGGKNYDEAIEKNTAETAKRIKTLTNVFSIPTFG